MTDTADLEKLCSKLREVAAVLSGYGRYSERDHVMAGADALSSLTLKAEAADALIAAAHGAATVLRSIAGGHGYGEGMSAEARELLGTLADALAEPTDLSTAVREDGSEGQ